MKRNTPWLRRNWLWFAIALLAVVLTGSVLYYLVLEPNDDICTRRFLGWEWREKDCNVIEEFFN